MVDLLTPGSANLGQANLTDIDLHTGHFAHRPLDKLALLVLPPALLATITEPKVECMIGSRPRRASMRTRMPFIRDVEKLNAIGAFEQEGLVEDA